MTDIKKLLTETRNEKSMDLDRMPPLKLLTLMNEEDENAVRAVKSQLPEIAAVVERCIKSLKKGGRLIYMGAGTSGRIGLLDAVECPPTFGVDPKQVIGLMAGGEKAFVKAVEGAEDNAALGEEDLRRVGLDSRDMVIGIAASGRTPYVIGGLRYASKTGCTTAAIVCNPDSEIAKEAEITVTLLAGPEVLTGSTRLKAGTAEKMVCNMISTASMAGMGKVYQNLMVDVVQTNQKLVCRAENIVMEAAGCARETARSILLKADGNAKTAIVAILAGVSVEEARSRLAKANGFVRNAIQSEAGNHDSSR